MRRQAAMADSDILKEMRCLSRRLSCRCHNDSSVCLPEGLYAVPGPTRLKDAIGDPEIERVTLQKK
jgi:hypothetical protein